jgi:hypothetical protein
VPVNVPWFLACTVGTQILILTVAATIWLIRSGTRLLDGFHPLRSLYSSLLWALNTGLRKLSGDQRMRAQAVWSRIVRRRDVYGSLATWPFLVVTQTFGVWFNVGILVVLLAQVSFKDIDFGWQSSFVESDAAAYRLTTAIAAPWSWFAPHPHPTLAEVAESHFTYKRARSNKAWWPFLCYTIACYGLLLRLALLALAVVRWRMAVNRLRFDHEGCPRLFRRMVGPFIHTHPTTGHESPSQFAAKPVRSSSGNAALLIAAEIEANHPRLAEYVTHAFGWNVVTKAPSRIDFPSGNGQLFEQLAARANELAGAVVAVPSDRPPIRAIALFLNRVANAIGPQRQLVLLLVGKENGHAFDVVDRDTLGYWQNFVAVNRLNVSLETWIGP